jgi:hypothetical protein
MQYSNRRSLSSLTTIVKGYKCNKVAKSIPLAFSCNEMKAVLKKARRPTIERRENKDTVWTLLKNFGKAGGNQGKVCGIPKWLTTAEGRRDQDLKKI